MEFIEYRLAVSWSLIMAQRIYGFDHGILVDPETGVITIARLSVIEIMVPPVIKTDTFTTDVTTSHYVCNKATAMNANLIAAVGSGRLYDISSIGIGTVTIDGNGSDTINEELTQVIYQGESLTIRDYAVGKWIIV